MSWTRAKARETGKSLGLLDSELDHIERELGRLPNSIELTVFAGMWSEHCSYKSTRHWLSELPKTGARVLAGPGSHAGVVDVGDGWAVAFKIESHNHPSAVEPYQGAATGVGGILRDVIAQGARPSAVMDSLCFGPADSPRTKHLLSGIVSGIAGYGNAFGVPNIGGRTVFEPRYDGNPLVNALAAGLVRPDEMRHGRAEGVGNSVLYVGATTGRDGILGAAFASEELGEDHQNVERRSHVQVGDPYAGKKLMEACLAYTPAMGLLGCQDLGACGISCAIYETAAVGDVGMDIELDAVPLREADMTAHEILLSESQERFLFIVKAGTEKQALAHFASYGVLAAVIGKVSPGPLVRARYRGESVCELPAKLVAGGAPILRWPLADALPKPKPYNDLAAPKDLAAELLGLLAEPGIADLERHVWGRYDQTVGNRTVRGPGQADAGVQKLPDSKRGYALTVTGRGEVCGVDPYLGAQAAIADGMRNLACAGAEMVAVTDGLNMGSPRDPVENLRLRDTIRGLGDALRTLGLPVTGGNVSLYNESPRGAIPPTPMVGSLGLIDDIARVPRGRWHEGEILFLLGWPSDAPALSTYGRRRSGEVGPAPLVDLAAEKRLAGFLVAEARAGRVRGAKGTGQGGLGVALAKLAVRSGIGAVLDIQELRMTRWDWFFFGEHPAQAWATVASGDTKAFGDAARKAGVPCLQLGTATGDTLVLAGVIDVAVVELARAFHGR
jgi:phosphoribosylformylglycinamidine synthase subunit PurL